MLKGCDISHWNGEYFIENLFTINNENRDFVMIKATEGKSYIDPQFKSNANQASAYKMCMGFYHYARPENNDPTSEANFFTKVIEPYIGKAIFALDWEGNSLKYDSDWILDWMNTVFTLTGVRPLLYTSKAYIKNYPEVASSNYGLWLARWAKQTGSVQPWNTWAIWQYTNQPFDLDYFNGTKEQWMKYCQAYSPESENNLEISLTATIGGKLWHGKTTLSLVTDSEEN